MPRWYQFVLLYLWVAPHLLLGVIPILMYRKRLHRSLPAFFAYSIYEVAVFFVLFTLARMGPSSRPAYRYTFIVSLAGSTLLRFAIIQELFENMLRDFSRLQAFARIAVQWLTVLLVSVSVVTAIYSAGSLSADFLAGIALLDRSIVIIQVGLIVALILFSRMFGLSLKSVVAGIALGFGVVASVELSVSAIRMAELSEYAKSIVDLLPTGGFHIAVLVWIGYLMASEQPISGSLALVPDIDEWSGELERQ